MTVVKSILVATVNVVFPALIVSFLSPEHLLGPKMAFFVALMLPLSYGALYLLQKGRLSLFSLIGLVSIILTGSFGVLELSRLWLILKETGIPLVIGLVILATGRNKRPFMGRLMSEVINMEHIEAAYLSRSNRKRFQRDIRKCNALFASVFFLGAILNFILSFFVLSSEPGTSEYAAEVGRLTMLSYPVIILPVILMLMVVFAIFASDIERATGNDFTDYMR
ncbi:MAG: VC0807 family protein [Candidatus Woesearchaeota archaeon]